MTATLRDVCCFLRLNEMNIERKIEAEEKMQECNIRDRARRQYGVGVLMRRCT